MKLVAFLRAINVGGHVVRMEELKRIFAAAGQSNVETFIASGNVIFHSKSRDIAALERKLEPALLASLGYEVTTFIRPMTAVARIAAHRPFGEVDGTLFVGFLSAPPAASQQQKVMALATSIDRFHIDGSELYWQRTNSESEISGATLERALGGRTTLRNVNTIRRIAAKYPEQRR